MWSCRSARSMSSEWQSTRTSISCMSVTSLASGKYFSVCPPGKRLNLHENRLNSLCNCLAMRSCWIQTQHMHVMALTNRVETVHRSRWIQAQHVHVMALTNRVDTVHSRVLFRYIWCRIEILRHVACFPSYGKCIFPSLYNEFPGRSHRCNDFWY